MNTTHLPNSSSPKYAHSMQSLPAGANTWVRTHSSMSSGNESMTWDHTDNTNAPSTIISTNTCPNKIKDLAQHKNEFEYHSPPMKT